MVRVLGCIFQQHDLRIVILAVGLCVLACATALSMISRARAAEAGRPRQWWLAGAGAVAGCGIWATHFVAMLAYHTELPIAFDVGLTALSAAIAMSLCGAGFALALAAGGAVGGAVTGAAIITMHYVGMAALQLPARAVWDIQYVIASALIGVSLSGLALHFALRGKGRHDYALGAGLFALAIVGMHFTGMSAVSFIPEAGHTFARMAMDRFALAVAVSAGAAFIVAQGWVLAIIDRHLTARAQGEALRMRHHIAELEKTQLALKKTSQDLTGALYVAAEASKAKSSFLASMSHELRTPLNAIIGFSDTMILEVFGPMSDRYKSYASDIRSSGEHLLALINDVLDLSRLDAGHADLREEEFDPGELISESLRMVVGQAAKAQVALTTHIASSLPHLKADKRRIKQILINLISNALKFTPAGGEVKVTAQLVPGGLAMAVADSGIGIAPDDIPKVMERFGMVDSSMSRQHAGTGLGLPLSKQLAEAHGGSLVLESTLNVGTTVTVTLPPERLTHRDAASAAA
jgi:signal transduction histidine kinase